MPSRNTHNELEYSRAEFYDRANSFGATRSASPNREFGADWYGTDLLRPALLRWISDTGELALINLRAVTVLGTERDYEELLFAMGTWREHEAIAHRAESLRRRLSVNPLYRRTPLCGQRLASSTFALTVRGAAGTVIVSHGSPEPEPPARAGWGRPEPPEEMLVLRLRQLVPFTTSVLALTGAIADKPAEGHPALPTESMYDLDYDPGRGRVVIRRSLAPLFGVEPWELTALACSLQALAGEAGELLGQAL